MSSSSRGCSRYRIVKGSIAIAKQTNAKQGKSEKK